MPIWVTVFATLLGGGAMGALIAAGISKWRNRQQPVRAVLTNETITRATHAEGEFNIAVTVQHGDEVEVFENLFLVTADVMNSGNRDWDNFTFGMTVGEDDKCVYAEAVGPDRHNTIAVQDRPSPADPRSILDFICTPFNRGVRYKIKLFVVAGEGEERPKKPQISSSAPVRFVDSPLLMSREGIGLIARELSPRFWFALGAMFVLNVLLSAIITGFILGLAQRQNDRASRHYEIRNKSGELVEGPWINEEDGRRFEIYGLYDALKVLDEEDREKVLKEVELFKVPVNASDQENSE